MREQTRSRKGHLRSLCALVRGRPEEEEGGPTPRKVVRGRRHGGGRGAVQDDEEGGEIPGVLFWSLAWHATTSACYDYRLAMHDLDVAFHLIGITHSWQACMR